MKRFYFLFLFCLNFGFLLFGLLRIMEKEMKIWNILSKLWIQIFWQGNGTVSDLLFDFFAGWSGWLRKVVFQILALLSCIHFVLEFSIIWNSSSSRLFNLLLDCWSVIGYWYLGCQHTFSVWWIYMSLHSCEMWVGW